ncbi:MAG: outer membrane beta-barrel protein [Bacteroidetes bacterium]|nr:outer membrane beta-barrel protein [Bacteroidota bacterium]MDA1120832.1 outer membrane beta-barrel protein [Bacteroidota bacterium]
MYAVPIYQGSSESKSEINKLWAGFGLGSGSFDPNVGGNSFSQADAAPAAFEDANFSAQNQSVRSLSEIKESNDPGISYSVGMNIGMRVAKRWIVQSGLQYRNSSSKTNTNVIFRENSSNESFAITSFSDERNSLNSGSIDIIQEDVSLTNNYQFLSIPLKIGYLVIDKKFQLSINTGFATDVFIKNRVSEKNSLIESYDQVTGGDSPYRRAFLSGMAGIELGYKIRERYFITVEPSFKRSLNSFTKNSELVSSNPNSLGVMAGFRYMF